MNGLVDIDMNYFFTVNANHTRSNGIKLTRVYLIVFLQTDWNSLPHDVVSAPNIFI